MAVIADLRTWIGSAALRVAVRSRDVRVRVEPHSREGCMETSARNQLRGTVVSVSLGAVMAEVTVDVNGAQVVAAITKESAERLGLVEGKSVFAIVKATDVMIGIAPV
jgi:molybdopterin-binding protein